MYIQLWRDEQILFGKVNVLIELMFHWYSSTDCNIYQVFVVCVYSYFILHNYIVNANVNLSTKPPCVHSELCKPLPCFLNHLLNGGCWKEKAPDLRVGAHFSIDEMIKLIYYYLGHWNCLFIVSLDNYKNRIGTKVKKVELVYPFENKNVNA